MSTAGVEATTDGDVESLLVSWELGKVHALVELPGGMFLKPTRLVTDTGTFVLREHTFRSTREAFQFQFDLVNGCTAAGIACPRVIPTRDGAIGVPHGGAFVALHEYATGTVHNWTKWHELKHRGDGFLRSLGAQVAQLHNVAGRLSPGGRKDLDIALPPIRFDALSEQRQDFEGRVACLPLMDNLVAPSSRAVFVSNLPRLRRQWDRLADWGLCAEVARLPRQPVHGDVSAVNLVFSEGAGKASFIDWDACHVGWRLYDALGDVLNRPPHERPEWNRFDIAEVTAFLDGYREVAEPAVTSEELRALPLFCLARQMEDLRQRLFTIANLRRELDEINSTLIHRRIEMMEQIDFFSLKF